MIDSVSLSGWRNHLERTVAFEPGLCFLLGANGTGKSSVLQAIAFGLFGSLPTAAPLNDAVSFGRERTSVDVVLTVGDERLRIEHVLLAGTRPKTSRTITRIGSSDSEMSAEPVTGLLGADAQSLLRLLFLGEGDVYRSDAGNLRLDHHLERILPFGALPSARATAVTLRRDVTRPLKTQRAALQTSRSELASLEDRRRELTSLLDSLEQDEHVAVERQRSLDAATRDAEQWRAAEVRQREWAERLAVMSDELGFTDSDVVAIQAVLAERVMHTDREIDGCMERLAHAEAAIEVASEALSLLEAVRDRCPVCHQTVSVDLHGEIVGAQRALIVSMTADRERARAELDAARAKAVEARRSADSVRALLSERPSSPAPEAASRTDLDEERRGTQDLVNRLRSERRSKQDEHSEVVERIATIEANRRAEQEVVRAFRGEAILDAVIESVDEFTTTVRSSIVRPIGEELTRAWKHFRPDVSWNIIIDEQGQLAMSDGSSVRPFSSLSAGEKTVATVLLRLAFVTAFTTADFVVLDEPLEHLDPRARRLLVSSLQRAIADGRLRQIIVSTYEESLVRRLIGRDEASAVYLD